MKVNFNDNASDFAALQQLLAQKALQTQMKDGQTEAGDKVSAKTAPPDRNSVLNLIAAENLLAAFSDVPDFESAQRLAEVTREDVVSRASSMVHGQANIAPNNVLKLLE